MILLENAGRANACIWRYPAGSSGETETGVPGIVAETVSREPAG